MKKKHLCRCLNAAISKYNTVWPRSSDPFCIVSYYIKWATTSRTDGNVHIVRVRYKGSGCKDKSLNRRRGFRKWGWAPRNRHTKALCPQEVFSRFLRKPPLGYPEITHYSMLNRCFSNLKCIWCILVLQKIFFSCNVLQNCQTILHSTHKLATL